MSVQCDQPVALEETRTDGNCDRLELTRTLQLKKEIGNARLVSGDSMLWVGRAALSVKDAASGAKQIRVQNGQRCFAFVLSANDESKQFLAELKEQVEGKAELEIRKKKRKIRKSLDQATTGFVPVNMLKSPVMKPPMTPTKNPSPNFSSPRIGKPLAISVATVPDAYAVVPSPSKSPYRSPFRKKPAAARQSPAPPAFSFDDSEAPISEPGTEPSPSRREWLSPVRYLKNRTSLTPPDIKRVKSPEDKADHGVYHQAGDAANKRVRSLQSMLDDVPEGTLHKSVTQSSAIVSPYFTAKSPPTLLRPNKSVEGSPHVNKATNVKFDANSAEDETSTEEISRDLSEKSPAQSLKTHHGLLNLGNYCYMNCIVQALAAVPEFVSSVQNEAWILRVIRQNVGIPKNLEQIKSSLDEWKKIDENKQHLIIRTKLQELLGQVIEGSETSINPESLKTAMGRKQSMFATYVPFSHRSSHSETHSSYAWFCRHLQQDAHEFLLNLLNEYEKELLSIVQGTMQKIKREDVTTTPPRKRSSLLSFFRSSPSPAAKDSRAKSLVEESDMVGHLAPAKCFRAELYRTLTCTNCKYSRKKEETFYDFSLDMPFRLIPLPPSPEPQTPLPSDEAKKQCFCSTDAVLVDSSTGKMFTCASSACSFREKVEEPEAETESSQLSTAPTSPAVAKKIDEGSSSLSRFQSILLEDLIKKQFEPETLDLTCEKCKEGKQAISSYHVKSLPSVLVLHLKRFEVNPHTGMPFKRSDLIEAPSSIRPLQAINRSDAVKEEMPYLLKVCCVRIYAVRRDN